MGRRFLFNLIVPFWLPPTHPCDFWFISSHCIYYFSCDALFPLVTQLPSTSSYSLVPSPSSSRHRCSLSFLLHLRIFFIIFSLIFFSLQIHAKIVEYTHPKQIKSNKNFHQQILIVLGSSYLGLWSDFKSELERPEVNSILCFPWRKDGEATRWAMV